jgi:hypothetical protein
MYLSTQLERIQSDILENCLCLLWVCGIKKGPHVAPSPEKVLSQPLKDLLFVVQLV